jgi:NAD(P)-dependent dehydrogenase (short-subunit alcohol dehydrogenase family)
VTPKNRFELSGKNALVTGGTGILGQHFCRALAEAGANVCVVDLDIDACRILATDLHSEFGVRAVGIACDVSDPFAVAQMAKAAEDGLGPISVLHNNAASKSDDLTAFFSAYEDYTLETWRKVMSVNVDGMFLVSQEIGKRMALHAMPGSIIQTASIYGVVAPDARIYEGSSYMGRAINTPAVYAVSKAAVLGLTRYLSVYWAPQGIRVNSLTPGGVESGQNETFKTKYSERVPLGRMALPGEMTAALVFLASDASSYITGHNLVVDGGLSVW